MCDLIIISVGALFISDKIGLTLDQILERRGWTDVYKNSNEWRNNVASCCGGDEVGSYINMCKCYWFKSDSVFNLYFCT